MTYGAHNALADVLTDLRSHEPLVDLLEDQTAISEGWPKDKQQFPAVVRVHPITENSSYMGGATERTFRFQFSVVVTQQWRDDQDQPTYRLAEIMSQVLDRVDVSSGIRGADPGEVASGTVEEVTGNRLAHIQDGLVTVRPKRR